MAKHIDVNNDGLPKGKSVPLGEVGTGQPVEVVAERNFVKAAELAKFMNETVVIRVHEDNSEGSIPVVVPSVNGINQPIIRGRNQPVKRKYVEALARTRTTKYVQKTPDPSKPDKIELEEATALTYPFSVIEDPNPIGKEWLQSIVAQR